MRSFRDLDAPVQVVLPEGTRYDQFVVPDCPSCLREERTNSMIKPEVIFFGESVSKEVKDRSYVSLVEHEHR